MRYGYSNEEITHAGMGAEAEALISRKRAEGDANFGSNIDLDGPKFLRWVEELRLSQTMNAGNG